MKQPIVDRRIGGRVIGAMKSRVGLATNRAKETNELVEHPIGTNVKHFYHSVLYHGGGIS